MRVRETKFFAVLRPGKISEVDAFELLKQAMGLAGIWDRQTANAFEKAKKKIQKRGTDVLPIALASIEFDFARVNHKQLDWVSLVSAELTPEFCGTFARELSRTSSLVMAAVLDRDYDYWQNAEDTLQYKAAGRSHAHLPMGRTFQAKVGSKDDCAKPAWCGVQNPTELLSPAGEKENSARCASEP